MYLRLSPYREVLQGVLTSLQVNEGIIKIIGKSGAGKTALCSQLFHELESNGQPAVFFLKPPASAISLQNDILDNLKLDPAGNFTRTLTAYLLGRTTAQGPLVLIFDDAQQLDAQTFSAIRMLCNIQDQSRALIRVILCGNEELDTRLEGPALRAVTQFVNQSFALPYLTQEQVNDFCQGYWLQAKEDMQPLSERSLQKLFQETRGHPGILQARLKQGTTGAEKSDRYRDAESTPAQTPPFKYAGPRQGWIPAMLTIVGLMLLGGAGAWYFLGPPVASEAVSANRAPPLADAPAVPDAKPPPASPAVTTIATVESTPAAIPDTEPAFVAPVQETAAADAAPTEATIDPIANAPDQSPATDELASEADAGNTPAPQSDPPLVVAPAVDAVAGASAAPAEPPLPPVEQFIAEWTTSWQEQDVDAYLAHYHPEFMPPQGATLETWSAQRRRVIENAMDIAVSADAPEFTGDAEDGARVVRFWLDYSAANYADRTLKELLLAPVDGKWRIRAETNLRTERL